MREIGAELIGGPYDGQTGMLQIGDEPQSRLLFNLGDKESAPSGLILPSESSGMDDQLTAVYVLIDEKPRKVITYDDNGRARSALGARYRYDKGSPCEQLFRQADDDALLTASARDQVMATRRLLLDELAKGEDS